MLYALVFLYVVSQAYGFNENDIEVISSLIQPFAIKQCILVMAIRDRISIITSKIKMFSEKNIFAAYFDLMGLVAYLKVRNSPTVRTAIVIKITKYTNLSIDFKKLQEEVSDSEVCSRFIWTLLISKDLENITHYGDFKVPFDCQFFIIRESGAGYELTEIYQISRKSKLKEVNYGYYCNSSHGLERSRKHEKRNDLEGREMIMTIPKEGPCHFITKCLHSEFWSDMGNILNYTTTTVVSKDLKDTKIKPDLIDILQVFFHLTKNTNHMVAPVLTAKAHLYIKTIEDHQEFWNAYLQPFDKRLWIATGCWIIISSCGLIIIAYFAAGILSLQGFTLLDQGLTPLTVLCNQGCCQRPKIVSSRIAKICVFIVSGIIVPAYSASIISFLTIDKAKLPFTDFETFTTDKSYKMATLSHPFFISFFRDSKDKAIREIGRKYLLNTTEFPVTHEESVDVLCKRDKLSLLILNYKILQIWSPCKITRIPHDLLSLNSGYELANEGLQYKRLFRELLLQFRSAGVINRAHRVMFGKTDFTTEKDFVSIEMKVVVSLIAVLSFGIITSALFFILEIMNCNRSCLNPQIPLSK